MRELRYSEEPVKDIWKKLLKYSFGSNVRKATGIEDEGIVNSISGSIVQAQEYFTAANNVTLNTSPLLMYYGCVNLLYGTALILTKQNIQIKTHGASLLMPKSEPSIGGTEISLSSSADGAFFTFNRILSKNNPFPKSWRVRDILSYIPDIKAEFEECYSPATSNCIPVETVKRKNDKLDRIHLADLKSDFQKESIVDFDKAYLNAQKTNEYIILREKLKSKEVGIFSMSGQKNLTVYSKRDGKNYYIDQLMAIFLGLYSLSVLSRYHPATWYPFVQRDDTGEKGLIEDFLMAASRKLPNLTLNFILGKEIHFLCNTMGTVDLSKDYDPEEVRKIVHEEIRTRRPGT